MKTLKNLRKQYRRSLSTLHFLLKCEYCDEDIVVTQSELSKIDTKTACNEFCEAKMINQSRETEPFSNRLKTAKFDRSFRCCYCGHINKVNEDELSDNLVSINDVINMVKQ